MNQAPGLILWIIENFKRLGTKMPIFFKVWAFISGFGVALTTLPQTISWLGLMNIHIPFLDAHANEIIRYCSTGALVMSFLTSQSKPVGVDQQGNIIKSTDTKKLPFTTASEQKIVDKESAQAVEIKPIN